MAVSKKIIDEGDVVDTDEVQELTDTGVDKNAPLEKKTKNKEILARLLKLEREIIKKARKKGIVK